MKFYYLKNNSNDYISKYGEIASSYIEVKKSKFYGYVFNISSEEDAIKYIDLVRNNNKDARHVVYVYSYINENSVSMRFSDDGEPQSTGTKGIIELLNKEEITNICIIVVRYFGGILLGAGPLARTYLNTFRQIINNTQKEKIHIYKDSFIEFKYEKLSTINNFLNKYIQNNEVIIKKVDYNENIIMYLNIDNSIFNDLMYEIKLLI